MAIPCVHSPNQSAQWPALKGAFMTKFKFALLLTAFAGTAALAQAPAASIGVAEEVRGLVTISQRKTLGNLVEDQKIFEGARVVTTSTGATVIKLDNGCRIRLNASQAITIDSRRECRALIASIESTRNIGGAVVAGGGSSTTPGLIALGVGIAVMASQKSGKLSGS